MAKVTHGVGSMLRDYRGRIVRRGADVAGAMGADLVSLISMAIVFPVVIRNLGPEIYGSYVILYLIFGLIGLWVYAAPTASIVQLILQLEYDPEQVMGLGRRQVIIVLAPCSLVGTGVAIAVVGEDFIVPAILVIVVDLLLTALMKLNLANIFAVDGVVRAARIGMIQPIIRACGVAILAFAGQVTILSLVCLNVAVSGLMLAASTLIIQTRQPPEWLGSQRPTPRLLARYSGYYAASMSTNAVQDEGEKLLLGAYRPAYEVGEYAAAYRVVQTTLLPMGALQAAAGRWFMVKDEQPGSQRMRTQRLSVVVAAYGALVAVAIILGADVIQWVAGAEYQEVSTIAIWLLLFPLLHGLADLPPMGLLGLGRNRERMFMGFGTSLVAIVCYLLLVPSFGWRGAVVGTYVSELVTVIAGWMLLVRYQNAADVARSVEDVSTGESLRSESGAEGDGRSRP